MKRVFGALVVAGSLVLAGCGGGGNNGDTDAGTGGTDAGGGNTNPNACGTDHAQVTAQQVHDTVINSVEYGCLSCHTSPATAGGGLALETVDLLKATNGKDARYSGDVKVVEANHSENSTMYLVMFSPVPKGPKNEVLAPSRMPVGGKELTAEHKKLIKDWICTGAQ